MKPISELKIENLRRDKGYQFSLYPNGQVKMIFVQQNEQITEKMLESLEALEVIDKLLNQDLEDDFYVITSGNLEDFMAIIMATKALLLYDDEIEIYDIKIES